MANMGRMHTLHVMPNTIGCFLMELHRNEEGIFAGEIIHLCSEKRIPFVGLGEAMLQMEQQLEKLDYPQASTVLRSFSKSKPTADEELSGGLSMKERMAREEERRKILEKAEIIQMPASFEKENTYRIRIIYRQNSSWQGEVVWKDKEHKQKSEYFKGGVIIHG